MAQLKNYLATADYEELAQTIADKVNAASIDLSEEKKELAEVTRQIANGVKTIMGGFTLPELEEEINTMRIRKSELEDIIARNSTKTHKRDKSKLVEFFNLSTQNIDENIKEIVKQHITKIYAALTALSPLMWAYILHIAETGVELLAN